MRMTPLTSIFLEQDRTIVGSSFQFTVARNIQFNLVIHYDGFRPFFRSLNSLSDNLNIDINLEQEEFGNTDTDVTSLLDRVAVAHVQGSEIVTFTFGDAFGRFLANKRSNQSIIQLFKINV